MLKMNKNSFYFNSKKTKFRFLIRTRNKKAEEQQPFFNYRKDPNFAL